jgi:hypothetical protein
MKTFCLPPKQIEKFKKALKEKDIKISDFIKLSSAERIKILSEYAGDSAKDVNLLFEQKLVLKNKMIGIKNWASKTGEVGRYSPEGVAKFEKAKEVYKAKQFERMFSPKEEESFLSSLVESKFGTEITKDEAKNVFNLTQKADELLKEYNPETREWSSKEAELRYGSTKRVLENYIEALKNPDLKVVEMIKGRASEFKQTARKDKTKAVSDLLMDSLKFVNDNSIAVVASVDDSFIGRQGLNTLESHPTVWAKGVATSLGNFVKTLGGKNAMDAVMAKVYSNPNYIDGSYEKSGILKKDEEQFPTSLPERIPVVGRIFKASESAFKGSAVVMRTGIYDLLEKTARSNGVDTADDIWRKDIGSIINSVTARGKGKITESELTRLVLWAPKMLKGNIDVLTAHFGGAGLKTSFARKQAWGNLTKIVAETVGAVIIINALRPDTVETDPRRSDFLKVKINDTRFDITAGKASIITLMARLITGQTKTQSGDIKKINSGDYGSSTLFDVGINFIINKTTPIARTAIDFLKGTDFKFEKTTVKGELFNKLPISIQNFYELKDNPSSEALLGAFVDLFGINSNTYKKKLPKLKKIR